MKVIIGLKYFSIKVVIFFFHTEFDEFQVSIFKKNLNSSFLHFLLLGKPVFRNK